MTQSIVQDSPLKQLLDRARVARQLTSIGTKALAGISISPKSGEDLLRKPAGECGLDVAPLDDIEPGRQLLSVFPAAREPAKARFRVSHARLGIPPMQTTF